jgi:quercetin dioxygenase-like cupin family protein
MQRTEFETALRRDGFPDLAEVTLAPGERRTGHRHPFDVRGLVLSGEFHLVCGDEDRCYRPGETFDLPRDREHYEAAGVEGAGYVAGRRH